MNLQSHTYKTLTCLKARALSISTSGRLRWIKLNIYSKQLSTVAHTVVFHAKMKVTSPATHFCLWSEGHKLVREFKLLTVSCVTLLADMTSTLLPQYSLIFVLHYFRHPCFTLHFSLVPASPVGLWFWIEGNCKSSICSPSRWTAYQIWEESRHSVYAIYF